MSIRKTGALMIGAGLLTALLSACEQEGLAEGAGEEIDKAVKEAGEAMEKTGEKAGEAMERAGEQLQDIAK